MKNIFFIVIISLTFNRISIAQIPMLNSNPSAIHKVILLDFNGQQVYGTPWNTAFNTPTINALPSTLNSAAMTQIWQRVSEDYRPFDVNVTTDEAVFNAANPVLRMRIVVTPSSGWYPNNVGGVAYLNSFSWGGSPDTPCWVFENKLSYSAKNCAEAASHEGGHTLSLKHQSVWNSSCAKTAEYHSGIGTGVTSWAPIMGVGYSKNVSIWHNGANSTTCTTFQYDHGSAGITGALFLNYRIDDVGDTYALGKTLNVNSAVVIDSSIITTPTDVDIFKFDVCNSRYMTFDVKPWALDTINYSGANLDVRLTLYNAITSASIAIDTNLTRLNARIGASLTPGSYYIKVDGGGSGNYSDYGSLGKYFLKISSDNIPSIVSAFNTLAPFCSGQTVNLTDASSGNPTAWSWTLTNASPNTSTLNSVSITYSTSGIYTIALSASNGTNVSCGTTQTIQVFDTPILTVTGNSPICANQSATLLASGANNYVWDNTFPSAVNIVNPTSNTTYTINGESNGCSTTQTVLVIINSLPVITATSNVMEICEGESANLNASGAVTYIWSNGSNTSSTTVSPLVTTNYTVTGTDVNGCKNSTVISLVVSWCTGINELEKESMFSLFPNPTKNQVIIKTSDCENCKLVILNILGEQIKTLELTNQETSINLSEQKQGVYQFIIYKNGIKTFSDKVIKN